MPSEFQFDLTGGQLALDLANTVSRRTDPERRNDHLTSYLELLSFARQTHTISTREAQQLQGHAAQHPGDTRRVLGKVVALREASYRVFSAIAQEKKPVAEDLQLIGGCAREALRHRELVPLNGGYGWQWRPDLKNPLDRLLWPRAQSAADLLTSPELKIVRFCEAPDCEWLFLDHSRNRSRRWCDMKICGNRQKARRHYRRTHS